MGKKRKLPGRKARGRPRTTGGGQMVAIRYDPEFIKKIDRWRAKQGGKLAASRSAAVRQLGEIGLAAAVRHKSK